MSNLNNFTVFKLPLAVYLYVGGQLVHSFSSVEDCEWSSWAECPTHCGGSEIQHRIRNCGENCTQACDPLNIESRHCNNTDCRESSDSQEFYNQSSANTASWASEGATQHVLNITDVTVENVERKLSTYDYQEEISNYTSDSLEEQELNNFNFTRNTAQNNLTTKIMTTTNLSADVENITEHYMVSLPTGASTSKSCEHCTQEENDKVFRYIREFFIAVLAFLLILVSVAFLCERKERLKQRREHSYICTLPRNTELNDIRESDVSYQTTMNISNLFVDGRAERFSSCIYQDITDLVAVDNLNSSRSTYQQIPVIHVNTEEVEG